MPSPGAEMPTRPLPLRAWDAIPVLVRAIVACLVIMLIGGSVSGALMFVNLQRAPAIPLFLPATLIWLWLFWKYLAGHGRPRATSARRSQALRAGKLSAKAWLWALVAGGCGIAGVMGIAFVTYRYAALPQAAYSAPFDVTSLPTLTLVAMFAAIALTAAVVEEAAFRGYLLSGIQGRYGWTAGIVVVTLLFYLAHLSHAYATLAFVPFFLAHGLLFGWLVYSTRSILPGIVLHGVSDFVVLPMQYGVIPSIGKWAFVSQGGLTLVAGVAAVFAFRQLTRTLALERGVPNG
jgi:membrane protease YdiL (CAAX protease family)